MSNQRTVIRFLVVTLLGLLAAGCGQTDSSKVAAPDAAHVVHVHLEKAAGNASANPAQAFSQDYDESIKVFTIADNEPDRYLIKNATLTIEARDPREVTSKVIADAKAQKGYVSDLHETVDALGTRSVTFVVRVPFSQFDAFLNKFDSLGKVLDREVTAEDVTEEFVDTQSKVHNLRATEARLLTHLSKTGRLSDTLLVEKEINRVREELDRLTGRLKFLAHRISFSTFNVTVKETAHAQAMTPPETFSAGKVVSESSRALVSFSQQVFTVAIWLLMWAVVWLPPALIFGYVQWRRRRSAPRNL
jgi:hypothetical protein